MTLQTASETISFTKALEEKAARFYEDLAARLPEEKDVLLSFARENRRFAAQIQRVYQSAITDAIEGCFAFRLDPEDFGIGAGMSGGASCADAIKEAAKLEQTMIRFYETASEQSVAWLADVSRNLALVGKKRRLRLSRLQRMEEGMGIASKQRD